MEDYLIKSHPSDQYFRKYGYRKEFEAYLSGKIGVSYERLLLSSESRQLANMLFFKTLEEIVTEEHRIRGYFTD